MVFITKNLYGKKCIGNFTIEKKKSHILLFTPIFIESLVTKIFLKYPTNL